VVALANTSLPPGMSNHLKNKHPEEFLLVQTSLPKEQASANICASKSNVKQLNLYECIQEKNLEHK